MAECSQSDSSIYLVLAASCHKSDPVQLVLAPVKNETNNHTSRAAPCISARDMKFAKVHKIWQFNIRGNYMPNVVTKCENNL